MQNRFLRWYMPGTCYKHLCVSLIIIGMCHFLGKIVIEIARMMGDEKILIRNSKLRQIF